MHFARRSTGGGGIGIWSIQFRPQILSRIALFISYDLLRCAGANDFSAPGSPFRPHIMIWSATLMTSRLCSMTITVFPYPQTFSTSSKTLNLRMQSALWVRPGYRWFCRCLFLQSAASFMRCDSPPERVVEGWPSVCILIQPDR